MLIIGESPIEQGKEKHEKLVSEFYVSFEVVNVVRVLPLSKIIF